MSIFSKIKQKREEDLAKLASLEKEMPSATEPLPQFQNVQTVQQIHPSLAQGVVQGEAVSQAPVEPQDDEIMTISDEEKEEFIFFYEEKYNSVVNDMQTAYEVIEDAKMREMSYLEDSHRKQILFINQKYDAQKKEIEKKLTPFKERFKHISNKFKTNLSGGQYENQVRPKPVQPAPIKSQGNENIFRQRITEEIVSPFDADSGEPELSKFLKELDRKYKS